MALLILLSVETKLLNPCSDPRLRPYLSGFIHFYKSNSYWRCLCIFSIHPRLIRQAPIVTRLPPIACPPTSSPQFSSAQLLRPFPEGDSSHRSNHGIAEFQPQSRGPRRRPRLRQPSQARGLVDDRVQPFESARPAAGRRELAQQCGGGHYREGSTEDAEAGGAVCEFRECDVELVSTVFPFVSSASGGLLGVEELQ